MAVHQITLADCLDAAKPPARVLTISVVDDTAFLAIEKYTEVDSETVKTKQLEDISVSLASLREALQLLTDDRDREGLRPLDPPDNQRGERGARLAGTRYGWVKL